MKTKYNADLGIIYSINDLHSFCFAILKRVTGVNRSHCSLLYLWSDGRECHLWVKIVGTYLLFLKKWFTLFKEWFTSNLFFLLCFPCLCPKQERETLFIACIVLCKRWYLLHCSLQKKWTSDVLFKKRKSFFCSQKTKI